MNPSTRVKVAVALAATFLVGWIVGNGGGGPVVPAEHESAAGHAYGGEAEAWTCSMHPQIQLPETGQCPICFMDLIPLEEDDTEGLGPSDLVLSESAVALAGIVTAPVERRSVTREIELTGMVEADETRVATITARVAGRLENLHVDSTGDRISAGDPLAEIYSPALYAVQSELLAAHGGVDAVAGAGPEVVADARATLAAARRRLHLWGMDEGQIDGIIENATVTDRLVLFAPTGGVVLRKEAVEGRYVQIGTPLYTIADLDTVWAVLEAHESQVASLRAGQAVDFSARARPGRTFTGEIIFVEPVLREASRSVGVRVVVANDEGLLKPGMLLRATVQVPLAEEGGEVPLVIPASAPLRTGRRAVVYVRDRERTEPTFSGRQVLLGPRAGEVYVVESGLDEGEEVVVQGNFKLDSALQIQARPSMMSAKAEVFVATPQAHALLEAVLDGYLLLQQALAADDDGGARVAGGQVEAAVARAATAPSGLGGAADKAWGRSLDSLAESITPVVAAADLAARRIVFQPLSDDLWRLLEQFSFAADEPVRRFHCPMAFDFAGADWIQQDKTTTNPYFGASMLRCGSEEARLGHGTSGEAR